MEELKSIPNLTSLIPCHAVRTGSTKEKAIERLERKINGLTDGRPIKFEKNRKYFGYVYEVEMGYEAILISLPKDIECNPIDLLRKYD